VPPVRHWQAGGFEPRQRAQYHPSKEILMRYATLTVTTENSTYEFAIHAWDTFVSATRGGSVLASLGTRYPACAAHQCKGR